MDESEVYAQKNPSRADTAGLQFHDLFDLVEIQRIQDAFSLATGVASLITDIKGHPITRPSQFRKVCSLIRTSPKGLERCIYSDALIGQKNPAGPIFGNCLSVGLLDGGTCISIGDRQIAKWLVGQVATDEFDEVWLRKYANEIGLDSAELLQAMTEVPRMSKEQFGNICEALHLICLLYTSPSPRD